MRRLIGLILLMTLSATAQTPAPATPAVATSPAASVSPSADAKTPEEAKKPEDPAHQELRDLRTKMQDAMNGGDVESLLENVTEDVVFSTMNGDVVRGKDGIRDYFNKMLSGADSPVKSVKTAFEADDLTILYGGSLGEPEVAGVAFGHSDDQYVLKDGTEFTVSPRWTATMIREPDGWKIASFHYSVNVFDNPIMNKMRSSLAKIASVAAVLCLVLGFVFGRLSARK